MWLVLCDSSDHSAIWAWRGLKGLGVAPVELVSADLLATAKSWNLEIGADGARSEIKLADGRVLSSTQILGTLNRIDSAIPPHLGNFIESDRDYVTHEWHASLHGWFRSLNGVVANPAAPPDLSGKHLSDLEWRVIAAASGFDLEERPKQPPSAGYGQALVVGDRLISSHRDPWLESACLSLARVAGLSILEIQFGFSGVSDRPGFLGASPLPDLRAGGPAVIEALARLFQRGAEFRT